jgi:disintegrin and metalloproteinase domain-containing protein 10
VRTKVPLKKKVRGERKKKVSSKAPALPQKENILPNSSANAATSPTLPVAILPVLKASSSKRQQKSTDSPRKLLRKKKKQRPSSEESTPKKEVEQNLPIKPSRKPKKKSKHKEVIDYSNADNHTNTFGKVQKWLLESPIVSSAASQIEHASKISNIINKSHSTPEHLTNMQRSPSNPKMKSATNLNDKVRLQVVYKPPFKFSLKFSKNDPNVKTKVIGIDKSQRKGRNERQRNSLEDPKRSRRTALLIRSATEEINNQLVSELHDEPMYETLNPKANPLQHQRQKSLTMPVDSNPNYENIPSSSTANLIDLSLTNSSTSPVINTATFRVNKSASGSNINNRSLPVIATPVMSKNRWTASQRGSQQNLTNSSGSGGRERRSSIENSTNLIKFGGSSQNLTRSSTTNLTKNRQDGVKRRASDMNRSSTTNLNKYHRQHSGHGSSTNLRRGGSNMDVNAGDEYHTVSSNERKANSRKNSVTTKDSMGSKSNIPRTYSNSNLMSATQLSGSSRRESFNNNIPRASLINTTSSNASNQFNRQISLNVKPTPLSQQSRLLIDELNKNRPQTSSCDSSMFKHFEWPKVLTTQRSLPVNDNQSDMEVMVSDVENLVNDR